MRIAEFLFGVLVEGRIVTGGNLHALFATHYPLAIIDYPLLAIRHSRLPTPTTFPRTGESRARRSRRCAAAGKAANRRPRPRPAASADPDYRALPCPRFARGAGVPRRCRRRNR